MRISLITTSFDRQVELDRFALGVAEQNHNAEIEVIFVSQGPAKLRLPVDSCAKVTMLEHRIGECIPLSVARNIGLQSATGDIVGFPDDDCWYEPNLLRNISEYFSRNPQIGCICTNVFDPQTKLSLQSERFFQRGLPLGRRPAQKNRNIDFRNLFKFVNSNGIFAKREVLEQIGGRFNEQLGVGCKIGSAEETELVSRMLSRSLVVQYVGEIQVYHPVIENNVYNPGKALEYNRGYGVLCGWLIKDGHFSVFLHFVCYLFRSCLATLLFFNTQGSRDSYWGRVKGMVKGLFEGLNSGSID